MSRLHTLRWRVTLLTAACVIAGCVVFYGFGENGSPVARALLFLLAIGACIGGALSVIDSLRKNTNQEPRT
jgi:uncharacterized membrane protein HdeD (DUF308 family)